MADFARRSPRRYATEGPALELGSGVHDGELVPEAEVQVPLRMTNRHGLIAGATGTGKTQTLQVLAEQLSAAGVPVFVADVKGDVSGLADAGRGRRPGGQARRRARHRRSRRPASRSSTSRSAASGPACRCARPSRDFGPQLLAKVLDANETQEQSLGLVFRYADQKGLPLLDLSDLRALLTFLDSDAGKAELDGHRRRSRRRRSACCCARSSGSRTAAATSSSASRSSTIADLLRTAPDGRGIISCLELPAVQDKPKLFSTALMWLLAELFEELPEVGDLDKPKLVFFFDEAHLLFDGATQGVPRVGRRRPCG